MSAPGRRLGERVPGEQRGVLDVAHPWCRALVERDDLVEATFFVAVVLHDAVPVEGRQAAHLGGELERWRYRIVDLADRNDPAEKQVWTELTTFWKELDAIGIDMYRSLTSRNQEVPADYDQLVALLRQRTDSFATQLDTAFTQISLTLDNERPVIFKELGYRSVTKGFIDPFAYAGQGTVDLVHQAAAYQAMFSSFWEAKWPWFGGFNFWEIHVDASKAGPQDNGFSPVGKDVTESVLKKYW